MAWAIGVDGGGTKTECVLVGPDGAVLARHTGPGCSPSLLGKARAGEMASGAIRAVRADHPGAVARTLLCMAGSRDFWREFGGRLEGCGRVATADDSLPVLELATGGGAGLALHGGTGSFVAARTPDGAVHYAGGLGWRFGDAGSGYDLGRRAIARGLLELQGWAEPSGLGRLLRERTGTSDAGDAAAHFYRDPETHTDVPDLARDVLRLAGEGDPAAGAAVAESVTRLLGLAVEVAGRLFPGQPPAGLRAGVSGPILNHPIAYALLRERAPFALARVTEPPIEGVRRLLARSAE